MRCKNELDPCWQAGSKEKKRKHFTGIVALELGLKG